MQIGWVYFNVGTAATRTGHDALYQGLFHWNSNFATKTRAGRITVPIGPGRVATYASGQPAPLHALETSQDQGTVAGTLGWTNRTTLPTITARRAAACSYDPVYGELIVAGGYLATFNNETWTLNLKTLAWRQLAKGPWTARSDAVMVYDTVRGLHVMTCGFDGGPLKETWEFNRATCQWLAGPDAPVALQGAVAVWTGTVLFLTSGSAPARQSASYTYNGVAWTTLTPAHHPPARYYGAAAYDSDRGVVVLHGGDTGAVDNDTWEYTFGATNDWAQVVPATTTPAARRQATLVYDTVRKLCLLAYGSPTTVGSGVYGWNGADWALQAASLPGTRYYASAVWDSTRLQTVIALGYDGAVNLNTTVTGAYGPTGLGAVPVTSFLGITSNNLAAWAATNATATAVDGPTGMRSAVRAAMTAANGYLQSGAGTIAGVTNISHQVTLWAKPGAAGTKLRVWLVFTGDAVVGTEVLLAITTDGLSTDWTRYCGSVTPVGAAHTAVAVRVGAIDNAASVDFEVPAATQTDQCPVGVLLVGNPAAEANVAQLVTLDNSLGKWYDPTKGSFEHRFHAGPAATPAMPRVKRQIFGAKTAGGLTGYCLCLEPTLKLQMFDSSGLLVVDLDSGIVPGPGDHQVFVEWNPSGAGLYGTSRVLLILDHVLVAHGGTSIFTPYAKTGLPTVEYASST